MTLVNRNRMSWNRERLCDQCGVLDVVRKDNKSTTCKTCAWKAKSKLAVLALNKRTLETATFCPVCGSKKHKSHTYCSVTCRSTVTSVVRTCQCCEAKFKVPRSRVDGKSNSSGNFCSRPCYERFLCRTGRVTGRGSQWAKIRRLVLAKSPFCGWCGSVRLRRLQVHHIVPFRLTFDNAESNLIPLCVTCHKKVEFSFVSVEGSLASPVELGEVFQVILRQRQSATRHLLLRLKNEV
jgi:hypothetical protein